MGNKRLTVREIAEIANVSIATVSRVSRGTGQVSPETRERVLKVIEEHGYRPSQMGRALAEQRHGSVAIVFPGLAGPYFSEVIQGFEFEALEAGASVHIVGTHGRAAADEDVLAMSARVDGIAVHGGTIQEETLRRLAAEVPVVVLAGQPLEGIPAVRADNSRVAELTRHLLLDHGYRRLTFVGNPDGSPDVTERWEAFKQGHREARVPAPKNPVRIGMQQSDGVIAAGELLDGRRPPGAIVCANDETALGVLIGALGRGLRVPEDVAITGFDDVAMSSLVQPGLTTIRQPIRELGAVTARLLLSGVGNPGALMNTVLTTELVLRGSCGCR
ncbi:LacI family transcriptional regulator [Kribbella amoyensis]|uniref:LacI family transcriptional regulator n=1 Tax=Kribbella amoyensis TaxID=996641 RepID=A0A561BQW0_9ACTN|nr:LacI family DNA-binding transcriptional regulator [Kribbella amoyensis]TWD81192.1 LacI family transcriptional regulator [Kribbella amoyensis]